MESAKLLVDAGVDPNDWFTDTHNVEWTLLTYSANIHYLDMVKFLLSVGADVELTYLNFDQTALCVALSRNTMGFNTSSSRIVEALLDGGIVKANI